MRYTLHLLIKFGNLLVHRSTTLSFIKEHIFPPKAKAKRQQYR